MLRETWAEIDLDAIRHNVRTIRSQIAPAVSVMACVKADGYGHGAFGIAKACLAAGVNSFGVATVEEGILLRSQGIVAPILVFGAIASLQAAEAAVSSGLLLTLGSQRELAWILQLAKRQTEHPVGVHVKIDTGMVRVGFRDPLEAVDALQQIARSRAVLHGVYTHFAHADEPLRIEDSFTEVQRTRFDDVLARARAAGVDCKVKHAANSAGILRGAAYHYDMVRPGIAVYGYAPRPEWKSVGLRPALTLWTTIVRLEEIKPGTSVSYGQTFVAEQRETIATLPIGYADGVPRDLSNVGYVRIGDQFARIAGRVCMDQMMVIVTGMSVQVGDRVRVYDGSVASPASLQQAADMLGTISYELICRISDRVPRMYTSQPADEPMA